MVGMSLIFITGYVPPRYVLKRVNWTILLFFAGLFVVMGGFEKAGYMDKFIAFGTRYLADTDLKSYLGLSFVTVILSNLISNVPAVILTEPLIKNLGNTQGLWLLLAMASTFAGNLTLIGSVANLIVAEKAEEQHITITFLTYLKIGLPLTLITLILGTVWLYYVS